MLLYLGHTMGIHSILPQHFGQTERLHYIVYSYRDVMLVNFSRRCFYSRWCEITIWCSWLHPWTHHAASKAGYRCREAARRCCRFRTFGGSRHNIGWHVRDFYSVGMVVVACWNDLQMCKLCLTNPQRLNIRLTSRISSRGNKRNGMSAALQAIRYPYSTRKTLSCAIIRRSFCSRSSSRIMGSRRTATSWYDYR